MINTKYEHYMWLVKNKLFNGSFCGYCDWLEQMK